MYTVVMTIYRTIISKNLKRGGRLRYASVVAQCLSSMHEALGLAVNTEKRKMKPKLV